MTVDDDGVVTGADCRQCPSPNCDDRPHGCSVDVVVVHGISLPPNEFGGEDIERLFQNELDCDAHPSYRDLKGLRVSAHALIRRDGSIVQFVPFGRRAWHAGESSHRGRDGCNDFSVGIELEGADDTPYEDAQYSALEELFQALKERYPDISGLVGHSDISPGRKTDPGPAFDWGRLLALVGERYDVR